MRPGPTISPKTETTCWWLHALVTVSSRSTSFIISEVSSSTFKPLSLRACFTVFLLHTKPGTQSTSSKQVGGFAT